MTNRERLELAMLQRKQEKLDALANAEREKEARRAAAEAKMLDEYKRTAELAAVLTEMCAGVQLLTGAPMRVQSPTERQVLGRLLAEDEELEAGLILMTFEFKDGQYHVYMSGVEKHFGTSAEVIEGTIVFLSDIDLKAIEAMRKLQHQQNSGRKGMFG